MITKKHYEKSQQAECDALYRREIVMPHSKEIEIFENYIVDY